MQTGDKLLITYDRATSSAEAFEEVLRFVDPGHAIPQTQIRSAYENRDRILDNLKNNKFANATWGIGETFEPGSLYYAWSKNRKTSNWRTSWSQEAKRVFHETGATESLIEFGFEKDADWWRQ